MSKFLKVTLVFAAFMAAFVMLPLMVLQASTAPQPDAASIPHAAGARTPLLRSPFCIPTTFTASWKPSGSNPGYARDVAVFNQVRTAVNAANVLVLDAGDEMQGSLLSNLNKGAPVIDLFNLVGRQAATFGNHEFDWGQQVLISRTQQANYPYVTANIVVSDTGNCSTAGWTTPVVR